MSWGGLMSRGGLTCDLFVPHFQIIFAQADKDKKNKKEKKENKEKKEKKNKQNEAELN